MTGAGAPAVHPPFIGRRLEPSSPDRTLSVMSDLSTSRVVEFDGATNFRDLGGYPSRFGGVVRWGRVYRAAALQGMTPSDLDRLAGLGITTIYDLRSEMEYTDEPDPVPSISVPILGRYMANHERPDFAAFVEHDHGVAFMRDMCLNMLHWGAPEIGSVITGLAEPDALPAAFHCTAGKDRTGIVAAILLEVLGVDREIVLDDFELTNQLRGPKEESAAFARMLGHGMPPEAAAGALGAPRHMMGDVLDALDAEYGNAERYLVEQSGVAPDTISRLRELLLTG